MKLSTTDRKKFRIRNKLKSVSKTDRYRLSISRSSKNISAQIIDDTKNITLVSATSNTKLIKNQKKNKNWAFIDSGWKNCRKSKKFKDK